MFDFNIPFKNFIFDIGNVILTWNPKKILENVLPGLESYEFYMDNIFRDPDWREFDRGTLSENETVLLFSRKTSLSIEIMQKIIQSIKTSFKPMDKSIFTLETLYNLGKKLFCLTNMSEEIFYYLNYKYDFWRYFEGIVVSGSIKMIKPESSIYRYILDKYSLRPQESLFIDDMEENISSARSLGISSIKFTNHHNFLIDLQKHSIAQNLSLGEISLCE